MPPQAPDAVCPSAPGWFTVSRSISTGMVAAASTPIDTVFFVRLRNRQRQLAFQLFRLLVAGSRQNEAARRQHHPEFPCSLIEAERCGNFFTIGRLGANGNRLALRVTSNSSYYGIQLFHRWTKVDLAVVPCRHCYRTRVRTFGLFWKARRHVGNRGWGIRQPFGMKAGDHRIFACFEIKKPVLSLRIADRSLTLGPAADPVRDGKHLQMHRNTRQWFTRLTVTVPEMTTSGTNFTTTDSSSV